MRFPRRLKASVRFFLVARVSETANTVRVSETKKGKKGKTFLRQQQNRRRRESAMNFPCRVLWSRWWWAELPGRSRKGWKISIFHSLSCCSSHRENQVGVEGVYVCKVEEKYFYFFISLLNMTAVVECFFFLLLLFHPITRAVVVRSWAGYVSTHTREFICLQFC